MDNKLKLLQSELGEERVKKNEKLTYHTYSKADGEAQYFYVATNTKELVVVLNLAFDLKMPHLLIGSGTKILISRKGVLGLVIKNRTAVVKVGGIKGKVSASGIGVEEALVEVDSGVSISKLNEFLEEQKLKKLIVNSSQHSTVGGAVFLDQLLINVTQKIKIWEDGEVYDIKPEALKIGRHVVLSVVLKVKAQDA